MNFKDFSAQEMVNYIRNKKGMDDEWFDISKWIQEFLANNPPPEEKKMFVPIGYAEVVGMMCDGIMRMKESVCFKCKKRKDGGYSSFCEEYPAPEGIPSKIWTIPDGECPYFE